MKKRTDPRHLKRIKLAQSLFTWSFGNQSISSSIKSIISHLKKIDNLIAKAATDRPLMEINKIDLAILRLSVSQLYQWGVGTGD
ncbi:hypothetical protein HYS94_04740 [Candidatus Daviesbacteria bacterium]|nr:hypothetical protein [Candidatus Daviesbacteria bacterium]